MLNSSTTSIFSSITVLGASRCPSTVLWGVVSIIVDSVETCFCKGFFSDVREKVLKRIKPSRTDLYATTTPIMIVPKAWVITPSFHTNPCSVFRGGVFTMLSKSAFCKFIIQTLATSGMTIIEVLNKNRNCFATIANTNPVVSVLCFMGKFFNKKPPISFPRNVVSFSHIKSIPENINLSTEGWY